MPSSELDIEQLKKLFADERGTLVEVAMLFNEIDRLRQIEAAARAFMTWEGDVDELAKRHQHLCVVLKLESTLNPKASQ